MPLPEGVPDGQHEPVEAHVRKAWFDARAGHPFEIRKYVGLGFEALPVGRDVCSFDGRVVLCSQPAADLMRCDGFDLAAPLTEGFEPALRVEQPRGHVVLHAVDLECGEDGVVVPQLLVEGVLGFCERTGAESLVHGPVEDLAHGIEHYGVDAVRGVELAAVYAAHESEHEVAVDPPRSCELFIRLGVVEPFDYHSESAPVLSGAEAKKSRRRLPKPCARRFCGTLPAPSTTSVVRVEAMRAFCCS